MNLKYELMEIKKILEVLDRCVNFKPCKVQFYFLSGDVIQSYVGTDRIKVEHFPPPNPPSYEYLLKQVNELSNKLKEHEKKSNKKSFFEGIRSALFERV